MDANVILLKDAAVRCLGSMTIDCADLHHMLDLSLMTSLCELKRVNLTESVLWVAANFLEQGLLT